MSDERPGEIRIGKMLEAARIRVSLDLATVEERTKIRARYLRALEGERWAELPGSAYAKGFLRTYSQLLGLDAEMVVDEYRRQVESGEPSPRAAASGPRAGLLIGVAAAIALAAAAVVVVALIAGDGETGEPERRPGDEPRSGGAGGGAGGGGTVELALKIHEPVEVCLVGGGGEALIDGQVLPAGGRERFERKRFELRFPSGFEAKQLEVKIGGEQGLLPRRDGPAGYAISPPARVRALGPPGMRCP